MLIKVSNAEKRLLEHALIILSLDKQDGPFYKDAMYVFHKILPEVDAFFLLMVEDYPTRLLPIYMESDIHLVFSLIYTFLP